MSARRNQMLPPECASGAEAARSRRPLAFRRSTAALAGATERSSSAQAALRASGRAQALPAPPIALKRSTPRPGLSAVGTMPPGLSQQVRPEVAGPMTGSAKLGTAFQARRPLLGFTSFNSGRKTLFSSSLPGLTRQSMRPPRTCGEAAWATGSSPVATSGKTYESCRCKQTRGWSGQAGGCPAMTAMSVSSSSPD